MLTHLLVQFCTICFIVKAALELSREGGKKCIFFPLFVGRAHDEFLFHKSTNEVVRYDFDLFWILSRGGLLGVGF